MGDPLDVSLIASIHNEEGNLVSLVERTVAAMERYPSVDAWEFLLVDDASTDGSPAILDGLRDRFPHYARVMHHPERRGQKGCFMTGFAQAKGRIAVLMDADLQVLPEELPRVLDEALQRRQEMVCTYNDPVRGGKPRHVVSRLGNLLMRCLFRSPVRDAGANFMAVETRFLRGVRLIANDQRYLLPIAMRRGLTKIAEVGCVFGVRAYGRSKYSYVRKTVGGVPEMFALRARLRAGRYDLPPVPAAEPHAVTQLRQTHGQWTLRRGEAVIAAAGWRPEPWDTQVLDIPTGRVTLERGAGDAEAQRRRLSKVLRATVDDARAQGMRFLALRVPERDVAAMHAAEAIGFRVIESYLTFSRAAEPVPETDARIRPARADERDGLAELAARTFRDHRYLADPQLPPERARETRRQWVHDAFAGRAEAIYVADVEGPPAGFVILRSRPSVDGEPVGTIELLAVDSGAAGQGLGRGLVAQALRHYAGRRGVVEVGTQGKNSAAIGLYTSMGFVPVRTEWTLHWHAGPRDPSATRGGPQPAATRQTAARDGGLPSAPPPAARPSSPR